MIWVMMIGAHRGVSPSHSACKGVCRATLGETLCKVSRRTGRQGELTQGLARFDNARIKIALGRHMAPLSARGMEGDEGVLRPGLGSMEAKRLDGSMGDSSWEAVVSDGSAVAKPPSVPCSALRTALGNHRPSARRRKRARRRVDPRTPHMRLREVYRDNDAI